nr:piriformospora indica-insensitive protein 2-like [Ipomoea trifida]
MGKHGVSSGNRIIRDGAHWEYSSFHGVHLRNVCYLGLDNNYLEGTVPAEFGTLEFVNELNLENNNLSGKVPFSVEFALRVGEKLKLHGNPLLCVDEGLRSAKVIGSLGNLKLWTVPAEFCALEFVNELNLENNNLSGKVPFFAEFALRVSEKLKTRQPSPLHG